MIKISPGEAELLDIFWSNGPLTLAKVHEIYTSGRGKPTLQTIQTRLVRMVGKGFLSRSEDYPAIFSVLLTQEQTQGKFFELVETLADRNFAPLMLSLAEKRPLKPEEIEALKYVLEKQNTK
ncbi:MAG: BlaI/MecI/CopY family transcriptional regulator [Thermoguttaceae bacterium]